MKKRMKLLLVAVAATWCCTVYSKGNTGGRNTGGPTTQPWLPLGLSIIAPPVQLPSPSHSLFGAMVNVGYGRMRDVYVLDVGLANSVTHNMAGLEVGLINLAVTSYGAQVGAYNETETLYGVQVGVFNFAGDLNGLQIGVLNFSPSGGATVFPILNYGF
ncbi:MAG: hypothetical protein IJL17_23240 [Kiritimatiellae bacterium]|nr:hypothetical protein [Kiritimatiellia bacterium]